jgi:hypothetical protein
MPLPKKVQLRPASLKKLRQLGFAVARGLPVRRGVGQALRPAREIATRLMALDAVFTWVAEEEKVVAGRRVRAYAKRSALVDAMTRDERAMFRAPRASAHARFVTGRQDRPPRLPPGHPPRRRPGTAPRAHLVSSARQRVGGHRPLDVIATRSFPSSFGCEN